MTKILEKLLLKCMFQKAIMNTLEANRKTELRNRITEIKNSLYGLIIFVFKII